MLGQIEIDDGRRNLPYPAPHARTHARTPPSITKKEDKLENERSDDNTRSRGAMERRDAVGDVEQK
jgi:hypothetical protein